MKLTKQGVRDLDSLGPKKPKPEALPPNCDHRRMRVCCKINGRGCGHWICDGCGLFWDDGGYQFYH